VTRCISSGVLLISPPQPGSGTAQNGIGGAVVDPPTKFVTASISFVGHLHHGRVSHSKGIDLKKGSGLRGEQNQQSGHDRTDVIQPSNRPAVAHRKATLNQSTPGWKTPGVLHFARSPAREAVAALERSLQAGLSSQPRAAAVEAGVPAASSSPSTWLAAGVRIHPRISTILKTSAGHPPPGRDSADEHLAAVAVADLAGDQPCW